MHTSFAAGMLLGKQCRLLFSQLAGSTAWKVEGSKCSIGEFITIYKQKFPDELKKAAEDLKKVEFNYEEAKKLRLIGRDGNSKDAEYNCITKNDVMEEVKKLADMATVRVLPIVRRLLSGLAS